MSTILKLKDLEKKLNVKKFELKKLIRYVGLKITHHMDVNDLNTMAIISPEKGRLKLWINPSSKKIRTPRDETEVVIYSIARVLVLARNDLPIDKIVINYEEVFDKDQYIGWMTNSTRELSKNILIE